MTLEQERESVMVPEETVWFLVRNTEGWNTGNVVLVIAHFVVPFVVLLQQWLKRRPLLIGIVCMLFVRLPFALFFVRVLNLGLDGAWYAMTIDLALRGNGVVALVVSVFFRLEVVGVAFAHIEQRAEHQSHRVDRPHEALELAGREHTVGCEQRNGVINCRNVRIRDVAVRESAVLIVEPFVVVVCRREQPLHVRSQIAWRSNLRLLHFTA